MKQFLLQVALGAVVFAVVNNNVSALSDYLRKQLQKALGFAEKEAKAAESAVVGVFKAKAAVVAPKPAPTPVTTQPGVK